MANTKIQSEQIADDVALAGSPTTTTQSASDNSTKVATTAYVTTAVANLVDSAPSSLNTLNELAAAMNDNASFFSTVLPLSGGTMTGNISHASDFTLDVGGDLNLDAAGGQLNFKDSGTTRVTFELDATPEVSFTGGNLAFNNLTQNADIAFKGFDDSSFITALNLDMSEAGFATFNDGATFSPNSGTLDIKVGTHDATNNVRLNAGGTTSTYLEYRGYLGHIFDVNTTRRMTLTSTGLGIGTDNPNTVLHVVGLNQTNGTLELVPNSAKGSFASFVHYGTNGDWYIRSASASGNVYIQDTGGNLLVGKTTTALATAGSLIGGAGFASLTRDGAEPLSLNRLSDDGKLAVLYAAGTEIGSLFTNGGALVVKGNSASAPVQIQTVDGNEDIEVDPDGFIKFETSGSERLRIDNDGIKFHGDTAQANGLNDYEEGTYQTQFTPTSSGSITLNGSYDDLVYVKIGRLVNVSGYIQVASVSSPVGRLRIGLPFTHDASSTNQSSVSLSFNGLASGIAINDAWGIISGNTNYVDVYVGSTYAVSSTFANYIQASTDLRITATYMTT